MFKTLFRILDGMYSKLASEIEETELKGSQMGRSKVYYNSSNLVAVWVKQIQNTFYKADISSDLVVVWVFTKTTIHQTWLLYKLNKFKILFPKPTIHLTWLLYEFSGMS